jgi:hypothetical protein
MTTDWLVEPMKLIGDAFNARDPEAAKFAMFATWAVDDLHYLVDIDRNYFAGGWRSIGYEWSSIDIAHTRWAAATAMTAVDLIAATIGQLHLPPRSDGSLYDLGSVTLGGAGVTCTSCRAWVVSTKGDATYASIKSYRDVAVHRAPNRHLFGRAGPAPDDISTDRTAFPFGASRLAAGLIVEQCRAFALKHVLAFIRLVESGVV